MIPDSDFQSLFEATPGLYLILSPDFTIVEATDAYLEATMTQRAAILGKGLFEIFPDNPDDHNADGVSNLRKSLHTVLGTKKLHRMPIQKYDIRRPDGTYEERYWSPFNKPLLNKQNEIKYIIHRVEDVTEFVQMQKENLAKEKLTADLQRKTIEMEMEIYLRSQEIKKMNDELELKVQERTHELLESEKKYRYSMDKMLEGVQIIDFNWRYIYLNDAVALQGQYPKESLLGYTMMEKYPGIENSELFQVLKKCMVERTTHHMENHFSYPDNTTGWFELSIQPVPEGIFILSIDITERKKAALEILKLNETLEKKVLKRTLELEIANKEISENNLQLKSVNQELNAFTYSVSHDLRAPLRAVDGYSQMLEEDYHSILDKEGFRLLNMIRYNAKRMGMLIDDLLVFSRLGRKEIQKSTVDMTILAQEVFNENEKSKNNNIIVSINHLASIPGDYALLKQVFINLIDNGLKYSSKKTNPTIELTSKNNEHETIYSIKDNGVGFDMKYVHKLFGVFQRLHTVEEFEGTGVGLAIVQRIIHKHGGKIWAEAEVGKGATFHFSLPIE